MIFRGLAGLILLLLLVGAVLGFLGADSELANPSLTQAKANRINAEAVALSDKAAYDRQLREIELAKQRALAQAEIDLKVQRAQLTHDALSWTFFLLSLGMFALMLATAMYVVCEAGARLRATGPMGRRRRSAACRADLQSVDHAPLRSRSSDSRGEVG